MHAHARMCVILGGVVVHRHCVMRAPRACWCEQRERDVTHVLSVVCMCTGVRADVNSDQQLSFEEFLAACESALMSGVGAVPLPTPQPVASASSGGKGALVALQSSLSKDTSAVRAWGPRVVEWGFVLFLSCWGCCLCAGCLGGCCGVDGREDGRGQGSDAWRQRRVR